MWKTLFKIKKLFNKKYTNVSKVYEPIYNDIGALSKPLVMTGANGIGGGTMGSYINIDSRVTNNTILEINSDSKDEILSSDFSLTLDRSYAGQVFERRIVIPNCYSVILDFTYTLPCSDNCNNTEGVYVILNYNGVNMLNTYRTTTRAIGGYGYAQYTDADTNTVGSSGFFVDKYTWHYSLISTFAKELTFGNAGTVEVIFKYNFQNYNERLASPLAGICNVYSIKKTNNDITRDIYATVIEQVDPTIN